MAFPARHVTPRLELRGFVEDDLDQLVALINDHEVTKWLATIPYPYGPDDGRAWLAKAKDFLGLEKQLQYAAVLKADRRLIGTAGITVAAGELGYWVGRRYWGRGYGWEMVRAVVACGFEAAGLAEIVAATDPDNAPSRRILEKLGFEFEGLRPYCRPAQDMDRPANHFRLTRDRWRAAHSAEADT